MAETKTVEMLRGVCTAAGALNQGKIVDLPTAQADEFVRIGYAKPAKGKQAEQRIPASEFGAQERAHVGDPVPYRGQRRRPAGVDEFFQRTRACCFSHPVNLTGCAV